MAHDTPFRGRRAVLVTRHGKGAAIAPVMAARLGLVVETAADIDTDQLGTFSGSVDRPGPAPDVVLRKARLAIGHCAPYVIASEGSFGPHPVYGFLARGVEHLALLDVASGRSVVVSIADLDTNFAHREAGPGEDISGFLAQARFPSHALMVRAAEWRPGDPVDLGVGDPDHLSAAILRHAALSRAARVRLDTDMRAHANPTRMAAIATAASRLADRLASSCPACGAFGFGRVDVLRGLRCGACDTPTPLVRAEIWACDACGHREERPRADGLQAADPGDCVVCNP